MRGARKSRRNVYYTLVHSRVCAAHIDPIEKKPLFHYLPGTNAFSIATAGCNVNCKFCQNWDISQSRPEQIPAQYIRRTRWPRSPRQYNCPTIAYTYSEPVVFAEYLMDTADAGHEAGVRSIVVSNGYMQHDSLVQAYGKMDAVKIDLKAFSESYYAKVVTGQLKPVLDSLVTLRKMRKWTEIVYLVVPTLNDDDAGFRGLAQWIKANLGPDVPLHFTQFHPEYLLKNLPITPIPTLERAKAIADAEGLHYVYIGNVPGHPAQNTYCPECRKMLVERLGFTAGQMLIRKDSTCPFCRHFIPESGTLERAQEVPIHEVRKELPHGLVDDTMHCTDGDRTHSARSRSIGRSRTKGQASRGCGLVLSRRPQGAFADDRRSAWEGRATTG